jgi:glutamate-1-semialdehyde aminotransferase
MSVGLEEVTCARDWAHSDRAFYQRLVEGALERGVMIDHDPREPLCLCYSHSDADIEETVNILGDAMKSAKY